MQWELKSPKGKGKNNIERQLQTGLKQSKNIIFDARRWVDGIRRRQCIGTGMMVVDGLKVVY